jgi:hypothetical protein
LPALPYQGGRDSAQGGEGVEERVFEERKLQKCNANACFFQSQATPTTKTKNGNHHATLKLIQRGMTIDIFGLGQPAWLEIAFKMASIGEGNYRVVKKRASFRLRSVCLFVLLRASKF